MKLHPELPRINPVFKLVEFCAVYFCFQLTGFTIAYEDTDLDKEEAYGYDWADAALILTIGKSL